MALPELLKKSVEVKLKKYCEARVPPHVRDKVRLAFQFRGNSVTLSEQRPGFQMPDKWVNVVVAQFRYDPEAGKWTLYCADRNSKWHLYHQAEPSANFETLLKAVNEDPTGIFWG